VTVGHADRNLEVVLLPVSDVDRSKKFYKVLRRREDADIMASNDPDGNGWVLQEVTQRLPGR
jgi:hypothetical protein